ncbi:OmpP1/FadL family transporter [Shumkonia mesophila]|uniref:OmpP1/FadL family transporter n=1 Tax=Shumkonia mesophila TaxID=2838854 RepID=UPI002934D210|nr:outer membrane protein transport protein [Shumkonia mesophila]
MRKTFTTSTALGAGLAVAALALTATPAAATNGYMGICVGAKNCGMAGAGVALPQDATSGVINPALMGRVKNQVTVSPGWFHPERSLDRSGATNNSLPKANEDSQHENFMEGSAGVNYHVSPEVTLGLSASGSGGMDTKYETSRTGTGFGVNGYDSEVTYRLLHVKPTATWAPNDWSAYGASVNIGWADFKSNMATNNNFAQTAGNNKRESIWGIGFTLGGLWDANEQLSFGASLSSPTWFQYFDNYGDLFLGSLDVPAHGTVGFVYRPTPQTDIAFDIKYIAWNSVYPIGKTPAAGGFGWESEPVFMLGAQHRLNDRYTVRAGYNYGPSPVHENVVFANGLFPAVTEHHFAVGASYVPSPKWELSASFFYALNNKVTDNGSGDQYSQMGAGVSVGMWQMGGQIGVSYNF